MPVKCSRCQGKASLIKEKDDAFLYRCRKCGKEWEIKKEKVQ